MNIGLYSFETLTASEITFLAESFKKTIEDDEMYVYSENINDKTLTERKSFERMLQDYQKGKIETIFFKEIEWLGDNNIIIAKALEQLLLNNCSFLCAFPKLESLSPEGIEKTKRYIKNLYKEENIVDKTLKIT